MRILSPDERSRIAGSLRALADELTKPKSHDTQLVLKTALEYGYPTTSSGAGGNRSNQTDEDGKPVQPDTKPEQLAIHPDREAAQAEALLSGLRVIGRQGDLLVAALLAWDPARQVRFCSRCQHPLPDDSSRCQQTDEDGRLCSATEKVERICMICDETQQPGEPLRSGRCNRCRLFLRRKGREYTTIAGYALQDNVIETEVADA